MLKVFTTTSAALSTPPSKILSYVLNNGIYLGVLFFFLNRLTKKLEERREEKWKEEEQVELTLTIGSFCYLREFLICCPIQQTQSDILRAQCCIVVEEIICFLHSVCTIYILGSWLLLACLFVMIAMQSILAQKSQGCKELPSLSVYFLFL